MKHFTSTSEATRYFDSLDCDGPVCYLLHETTRPGIGRCKYWLYVRGSQWN